MTAGVVLARLDTDPQLSFFDATEEPTVRALLDLLLAQHDEPKVPVTELIDERLLAGLTDGWHYEDMPEDGEAWHRSLAALDEEAHAVFGQHLSPSALEQQGSWSRRSKTPTSGTASRPSISGACGPVTPARPSTPTRGPGTRWASADPPTRGVTRTWASTAGRSGSARKTMPKDPVPWAQRRESAQRSHEVQLPRDRSKERTTRRRPEVSRLRDADIRARNESAWLLPTGDERTNHRLRRDMRHYDENDEVDVVVVGCGAGGATFIQRLARAGASIVGLDAGPFWDPDADWVSDEWGSHRLYWTEPRVISGDDPVPLGSNNSGRGRRGIDDPLRRLHAALSPVGLRDGHS